MRRSARACLLGAASLVSASFAAPDLHAQTIIGFVVDAESRAPITGAEIEVGRAGGDVVARMSTDSAGFVRALLPTAGEYVILARRIGYAEYSSEPVRVEAGESVQIEIRLGRDAIPLEPLVVVTRARRSARLEGFRRRLSEGGFGSFVTRQDIDRRPAASVADLIQPLPGVDILEVPRSTDPSALSRMVVMRGTRSGEIPGVPDANVCLPGVFLDGVRVEQSVEFPVDELLTSDSLEGIEVYSSAGSVPIEFQQGGRVGCGAVLLWSRAGEPGQGRSGWWRWALGLTGFAGIVFLMR